MLNAKHTLENMLSHYDASIEDIDPLFGQSLSTIDTYIQAKIPQKIYAQHAGILLPTTEDKTNNMSAYHKKFTDIASIIDHHSFKIDLYIHEKDINKAFVGQKAQITINALQTTISGEITNVLNYPSTSHPNQYQVQVKFSELAEEQLGTLKVGMGCSVNILLSEYEALLVPIASVKTIMGQNMVTVIDEAKKMTQREVKLGGTQDMQIEILDGLEAGEEIFEHH
jgi:multidrug efflux pump subunit AcrA (membrane-fusion protein)